MKVYVVYRGAYNDRSVHGVFSGMEKALAYVAPIQQEWQSDPKHRWELGAPCGPDFEIWECELDGVEYSNLTDVTPDYRLLPTVGEDFKGYR